jgi:Fe2+ or Zn2+ uptake regulation protein
MASKKGLSSEEKRKRMLEFFFEKQDFFQLKDVEKLCSQEKGITIQTIKDILTSLVDDGLVESEKIGTSVYFWALPSRALQKRQDTIRKLENDLESEKNKNKQLKEKQEKQNGIQINEEKNKELQVEYDKLIKQRAALLKELDSYKENDPEACQKMENNIKIAKEACNRWIENIYSLKSWLKNKFRVNEDVIDKQFEIPSDLDYVS